MVQTRAGNDYVLTVSINNNSKDTKDCLETQTRITINSVGTLQEESIASYISA